MSGFARFILVNYKQDLLGKNTGDNTVDQIIKVPFYVMLMLHLRHMLLDETLLKDDRKYLPILKMKVRIWKPRTRTSEWLDLGYVWYCICIWMLSCGNTIVRSECSSKTQRFSWLTCSPTVRPVLTFCTFQNSTNVFSHRFWGDLIQPALFQFTPWSLLVLADLMFKTSNILIMFTKMKLRGINLFLISSVQW